MNLTVDIPKDMRAPATARDAVRDLDALDPDVADDTLLLVSELVTNGVKYGGAGPLRLEIDASGPRRLCGEVIDQGSGFVPRTRDRPDTEPGGWGLHLVDRLTDRWGVREGSTHVWFEIDRSS
jgi:anti-sigma regulatory factor (Ser/Thr protein kinase)